MEKRKRTSAIVLITAFVLAVSAIRIEAESGDLDPTFGTGGKVVTDMGYLGDRAKGVRSLPDGRLALATERQIAIFSASGVLEQVFGENGDKYTGITVQQDGKIVTIGSNTRWSYNCTAKRIFVRRFNPDGTADTNFGVHSGITSYSPGCTESGYLAESRAVVLQSDGKIVVAGSLATGNYSAFLAFRLNADGTFDNSFNQDGIGFYSIGNGDDVAVDVAVQPSTGKIGLAGYSKHNSETLGSLVMLESDGTYADAFGYFGKRTHDHYPNDGSITDSQFLSLKFQADGKLLAGGHVSGAPFIGSPPQPSYIARYNLDGMLDTTFGGGDGMAMYDDAMGPKPIIDLAVQRSKKIIAVSYGWVPYGSNFDFVVFRFNANGSLDSTFSGDGVQSFDFAGNDDYLGGMATQPDGKIVLAGMTRVFTAQYADDYDIALARFLP